MVRVAELKMLEPTGETCTVARFVLMPDGTVRIVGLTPHGKEFAESITEHGIPGPKDGMVPLQDGARFLHYLSQAFTGHRLWATEVFPMELSQALLGYAQEDEV